MRYDCVIIGGGLSGLTCGIRLAETGASVAVISTGMSALHFSSGSIDLFGYNGEGRTVYRPFEFLDEFVGSNPRHPYALCGARQVREALFYFRGQLDLEGIELYNNDESNHFHVTTLGTLKPTFFSQRSVFNEKIRLAFEKKSMIAALNFEGYRDFYPELAVINLRRNILFRNIEIITGKIVYPDYGDPQRNPFEYRSVDIARIFDTERYLEELAVQIRNAASGAAFAAMPAFLGISNFKRHHKLLQELTGLLIYEIPTLPPSILGMRIDNALKSRFASLGGVYIAGDTVTGGSISGERLESVVTENGGGSALSAGSFVLATGSFFSGGLVSEFSRVREPVLDLKVYSDAERSRWYAPEFFPRRGHPFLEYGVETDERLNPKTGDGRRVKNLYCTGALLPYYNPIKEGSGGGVAVSTGYRAAELILEGNS